MDIIKPTRQPRSLKSKAAVLPYLSVVIREERVKLGLKQIELAKKVGIGLKTLRKIEQGNLNINFDKLNYLLNCLGFYLRPTELVSSPLKNEKIRHSKESILQILKSIFPIFEIKYKVTELSLFGSYSRGLQNTESDIDVLIDFEKPVSLETEGEIQIILENLFSGTKVDLTTKRNLQETFLKEIEESKINVREIL